MSLFAMGNFPTTWPPFAPAGRCVGCGYDLAGIRARACPECGRNRPAFDECRACGSPLAGRPPGHCASCFTPYAGPSVCQSCGHAIGLDPAPACPHCTAPRLQNA
jgi:rubrerythrin